METNARKKNVILWQFTEDSLTLLKYLNFDIVANLYIHVAEWQNTDQCVIITETNDQAIKEQGL